MYKKEKRKKRNADLKAPDGNVMQMEEAAAAVPVVHGVGAVGERLRGRYVSVGPVRLGRRGGRGRGMMEGGHGGAARGRHWAGGLHSCRLLLLIGTAVKKGQRCKESKARQATAVFGGFDSLRRQ